MSSLGDSLRVKAAGVKSPAISGQAPLKTPDVTSPEGQSGGIAKSKAVKNAGSTQVGNQSSPANQGFINRLGVKTNKNSTNEYM